jgi:hypothetical protein
MGLKIQTYLIKFGLEKAIKEFDLKTRDYGHKILLKYNQLSSPSIMALPEVQECRGLILEKGTWRVMSMGFTKFFNSEESNAHKIDWETAVILEKLDGTMIQVYYDDHDMTWYGGTTGTANGEGEVNNKLGTTFNQLFWNTIKEKYPTFRMEWLDKNVTYVFELTTPYNIVVKPHGESSATLLTARHNVSLKEASRAELFECAKALHLPIVKSYDFTGKNFGEILRSFDGLDSFFEGYVVVDAKFNRVKVKSPKYVAIHHLKNKTAEYAIMDVVKNNEIEEFCAVIPERKSELISLKKNYDDLINELTLVWDNLYKPKNITPEEKKKFAKAVFDICNTNKKLKQFSGLFFGLSQNKIGGVSEYIMKYDSKSLYKLLG